MCVHIDQISNIHKLLTELSQYTQLTKYTQTEIREAHKVIFDLCVHERTHNNDKNKRNLSKSANTHKSKIQECHD